MKTSSNKPIIIILVSILLICAVFVSYLFLGNNIGVRKTNLISDVRNSQKIAEDWTTYGEATDTLGAYISYPQDKSEHTYSIYTNKKGLSFGYFFRAGGDNSVIDNSIAEFTITDYSDRAFISMNNQNVVRVDIDTEDGIVTKKLKSNEPFAFILQNNSVNVTFYDVDGNVVEYINQPL